MPPSSIPSQVSPSKGTILARVQQRLDRRIAEYDSAGPRFAFEYDPMVLELPASAPAKAFPTATMNTLGAQVSLGLPAVFADGVRHLFEPKSHASADPFTAEIKNKVGSWNMPFAGTASGSTASVVPVCMKTHARLAMVNCIRNRQADLVIQGRNHPQQCQCATCSEIRLANSHHELSPEDEGLGNIG
ncbi:hypothetical protein LTR78_001291 [Recurvomyces mirabilis]|uniref:Uncharacterized protein n=1 Tax=Recurvomyces mirabilis TaxID=574656 RepID=A0AAE1C5G9_9PEZI|nr:hypothetical protein LTR78_001291 [Recurvomyces mirabilis]KAK5161268.1 hypothetical protein LTS14_001064 [Recurvomyces mirabilis]